MLERAAEAGDGEFEGWPERVRDKFEIWDDTRNNWATLAHEAGTVYIMGIKERDGHIRDYFFTARRVRRWAELPALRVAEVYDLHDRLADYGDCELTKTMDADSLVRMFDEGDKLVRGTT